MKLTVEQLQERMQYIRDHVESFNTEERATALNKMYDHFEERMMLAPASSVDYFHKKLGKIMWNKCGMARNKKI